MSYTELFKTLDIGPVTLTNRIFMAPLTRVRSREPGDVPTELMRKYYRQRASAGLIITEATQVSFQAKGYSGAPGLHTEAQIAEWKKINNAIHNDGGHSCVQLWHTGRISHSSLQPGGKPPVAPSAITANARTSIRDQDGNVIRVKTSEPVALTTEGIKNIVNDFRKAAINAKNAGFDFAEIHAAHGYLVHQFLSSEANHRVDEYGGSIENRARFALEIADAMIDAWSADRIGIRIYPLGAFNGVENDIENEEAALYLIRELAKRNMAYLHISEPDWAGGKPLTSKFRESIRKEWPGIIIAAGAYSPEKAEVLIKKGLIDAVAFGRDFIANPDLPERIYSGAQLNDPRPETFYANGEEGYTDYPFLTDI